jgi:hypothetical protein
MNYFKITETNQKTSEILSECKALFNVWSWFDDDELDRQFPPPKKVTTRYFKKNVEADEELKNKSAENLEGIGGEYHSERETNSRTQILQRDWKPLGHRQYNALRGLSLCGWRRAERGLGSGGSQVARRLERGAACRSVPAGSCLHF